MTLASSPVTNIDVRQVTIHLNSEQQCAVHFKTMHQQIHKATGQTQRISGQVGVTRVQTPRLYLQSAAQ